MKLLGFKKSTAVTLFEMLLVLFVSSMVAVSAFKYQQQERASNVAEPLAQKMYVYAQTVRQFVVDNQVEIASGTLNPFVPPVSLPAGSTFTVTGSGENTVYKFTGISWLQAIKPPGSEVPYLPSAFTFGGLNPLELRRGDLVGNAAIEVRITATKITILYGALYSLAAQQQLEGSVTALAANKANKLYDNLLGISSFNYVGGVDKNGVVIPITAVWDKTQSEDTNLNTDTNIDGSLEVSGDMHLKSTGADAGTDAPGEADDNSADIVGVGTLAFDQAIATAITQLDKINFSLNGHRKNPDGSPAEGGEIENLGYIDMVDGGEIEGIGVIKFDESDSDPGGSGNEIIGLEDIIFAPGDDTAITFPPDGGLLDNIKRINFVTGGKIKNLDTIEFDSAGAGKLNGVKSIEFSDGKLFKGFDAPIIVESCAGCNDQSTQIDNTMFHTSYFLCFLNKSRMNDGDSGKNKSCSLSVQNGFYRIHFENALSCGMQCIRYR